MTSPRPPWYVTAFEAAYDDVYFHRSDELAAGEVGAALRFMDLSPGARLLDLACGNGRHSRALEASGFNVFGVDLSRHLLAKHQKSGGRHLARADMRSLPFASEIFDGVLSFFTSFGYFDCDTDDLKVLGECARVSKVRGRLFLDFLDAATIRQTLKARTVREQGGKRIEEERRIDDHRVKKRVRVITEASPAAVLEYEESVRLYERVEIETMLNQSGFRMKSSYGAFDGRSVGAGDRLIIVAERVA